MHRRVILKSGTLWPCALENVTTPATKFQQFSVQILWDHVGYSTSIFVLLLVALCCTSRYFKGQDARQQWRAALKRWSNAMPTRSLRCCELSSIWLQLLQCETCENHLKTGRSTRLQLCWSSPVYSYEFYRPKLTGRDTSKGIDCKEHFVDDLYFEV